MILIKIQRKLFKVLNFLQLNFEELSQKHENEMSAMHSEYEQDRIAYQKLLKTYNKLEIQYENLQVILIFLM